MTDTDTQDSTASARVSRMPPGTVADIDAHQGWALSRHDPDPAAAPGIDLLFVHGMSAGGWIWPPEWLLAFTAAGHRCWTMTLPGREGGNSIGRDPGVLDRALGHAQSTGDVAVAADMLARALPAAALLDGPTLDDFADAVQAAMARIGRPVILVGHSLGGAVAQLLLRRGGPAAGTVLLASVPPYGTWRAAADMALTRPALWAVLARFTIFGPAAVDPEEMRDVFYPNGVAQARYAQLIAGLRDESLAATAQAMGLPPFAPLPGRRDDVLVIGGDADSVVPPLDLWLTAAYYGTTPLIVPRAGHMLMHEAAEIRQAVVEKIVDWTALRSAELAAKTAA